MRRDGVDDKGEQECVTVTIAISVQCTKGGLGVGVTPACLLPGVGFGCVGSRFVEVSILYYDHLQLSTDNNISDNTQCRKDISSLSAISVKINCNIVCVTVGSESYRHSLFISFSHLVLGTFKAFFVTASGITRPESDCGVCSSPWFRLLLIWQ